MKIALILAVVVACGCGCVAGSPRPGPEPQARFQVLDGLSTWLSAFGVSKPKFACQNGIFGPTLPSVFKTARCMLTQLEAHTNLNVNCLYFCAAKVFDLLDPITGLPTKEKYHQLAHNNFPGNLVRKAVNHFDTCLDKYGSIELDDKKCTQAGLLHSCTWSIIDEMVC